MRLSNEGLRYFKSVDSAAEQGSVDQAGPGYRYSPFHIPANALICSRSIPAACVCVCMCVCKITLSAVNGTLQRHKPIPVCTSSLAPIGFLGLKWQIFRYCCYGSGEIAQACCITRHRRSSHVTRHTSHVTRHTSLITHHPSPITRHTSHVTHHTLPITHHPSHIPHPLPGLLPHGRCLRFHLRAAPQRGCCACAGCARWRAG